MMMEGRHSRRSNAEEWNSWRGQRACNPSRRMIVRARSWQILHSFTNTLATRGEEASDENDKRADANAAQSFLQSETRARGCIFERLQGFACKVHSEAAENALLGA